MQLWLQSMPLHQLLWRQLLVHCWRLPLLQELQVSLSNSSVVATAKSVIFVSATAPASQCSPACRPFRLDYVRGLHGSVCMRLAIVCIPGHLGHEGATEIRRPYEVVAQSRRPAVR